MVSWTHPDPTERKLRKSDALAIQLPSSSLVEDNIEMGTLLCDFLQAEGYTTVHSTDGLDAMNRMNGDIFAEIKDQKMVVTAVFGMA